MRRPDVVDEADLGPADGGEIGDVAGLACAHLQHGEFGVLGQGQYGQGQADLVVEIADGHVGTTVALQDRGGQGLDGGLAIGSGDADHAGTALGAHGAGEVAQRQQRVAHQDLRQINLDPSADQSRGGAALARLCHEGMRVVRFAHQGNEELAATQRACIGGHTAHHAVGADQPSVGEGGDVGQTQGGHAWPSAAARAASALRATTRSSKGSLRPAISW